MKQMCHRTPNIDFWNHAQSCFGSLIPSIGTAHALTTLNKLGCWLVKESNATSDALTGLLTDVDSVRHATLQNWAATDFLLLAQGHGCEDFNRTCCMNLSDHSVHKSIQDLKELSGEVRQNQGWDPFRLFSWLGNFGSWLRHIAGFVVIGLIALLIIMSTMFVFLYPTTYKSKHKSSNAYTNTYCASSAKLNKEGGNATECD